MAEVNLDVKCINYTKKYRYKVEKKRRNVWN